MEALAIIMSIIGVAGFFGYLASQFKTSNEGGTKYGSVMKILFNSVAFTIVLVLPIAGMQIAANQDWNNLQTIMQVTLIPTVFTYLLYLLYLVIVYSEDAFGSMTGKEKL